MNTMLLVSFYRVILLLLAPSIIFFFILFLGSAYDKIPSVYKIRMTLIFLCLLFLRFFFVTTYLDPEKVRKHKPDRPSNAAIMEASMQFVREILRDSMTLEYIRDKQPAIYQNNDQSYQVSSEVYAVNSLGARKRIRYEAFLIYRGHGMWGQKEIHLFNDADDTAKGTILRGRLPL